MTDTSTVNYEDLPSHTLFLRGGLGNILFQLAMASKVSSSLGGSFQVSSRYTAALQDEPTMRTVSSISGDLGFQLKVLGSGRHTFELAKQAARGGVLFLEKSDFNSISNADGDRRPRAVSGYFQNYSELKEQIELVSDSTRDHLAINDMVDRNQFNVLHVRLGDYRNLAHLYGEPSSHYYTRALERLRQDEGHKRLPLIVVSDDRDGACDFVSNFLDRSEFELAPSVSSPMEHFALLAGARNIVAPSSTFSWWAAQVGQAKRVFLPSPLLLDPVKNRRINLASPNAEFLLR